MNRPLITVITVCLNCSKTLECALKSVLTQDFDDYEYIIVDGGSTDRTLDIIAQYHYAFKHIISESDDGIYDAMNKGLALATGHYLFFLNSDDYLEHRGVFSRIKSIHRSLDCPTIIAGSIRFDAPSGSRSLQRMRNSWYASNNSDIVNPLFFAQNPHPGLFVPLDTLKSHSIKFNTKLTIASDLQLQLELFKLSVFIYSTSDVFACMTLGGKSSADLASLLIGFSETVSAYNNVFRRNGTLFAIIKLIRKAVCGLRPC
jgi:glycosyltransferase involved in cell wall biosynthesis